MAAGLGGSGGQLKRTSASFHASRACGAPRFSFYAGLRPVPRDPRGCEETPRSFNRPSRAISRPTSRGHAGPAAASPRKWGHGAMACPRRPS